MILPIDASSFGVDGFSDAMFAQMKFLAGPFYFYPYAAVRIRVKTALILMLANGADLTERRGCIFG